MYTGMSIMALRNLPFFSAAAIKQSAAQNAISNTNAHTRPIEKNSALTAYIPPSAEATSTRSILNLIDSSFDARKKHKKSILKFIIK
jgi:hypothetical protein